MPFCRRVSASVEKVENVVKPPQSPTVKNKLTLGGKLGCLPAKPQINPIIRQPTRFTVNVPHGNTLCDLIAIAIR